jgi:hypothetical protein
VTDHDSREETDLDLSDEWRTKIAGAIKYLKVVLPSQISNKLDYSTMSLNVIEAWLLARYPMAEDVLDEPDADLFHAAVIYVGETYRRHLSGEWHTHLSEPDRERTEIEVIEGFDKKDKSASICPEDRVYEAIHERIETYLRQDLSGLVKQYRSETDQ